MDVDLNVDSNLEIIDNNYIENYGTYNVLDICLFIATECGRTDLVKELLSFNFYNIGEKSKIEDIIWGIGNVYPDDNNYNKLNTLLKCL